MDTADTITFDWLRNLAQRDYVDLGASIARVCALGYRVYSLEEYETCIACVESRLPEIHLLELRPHPYLPRNLDGSFSTDVGFVEFRCTAEQALAAGFVTEDLLPKGRKRLVSEIQSDPLQPSAIKVWRNGMPRGDFTVRFGVPEMLPESHPLAMFTPHAIRASMLLATPWPSVLAATQGGARCSKYPGAWTESPDHVPGFSCKDIASRRSARPPRANMK